MRLFLAIDLPVEVQDECVRLQSLMKSKGLALTKTFHITLKFFPDADSDSIVNKLSNLKFTPFSACLTKLGHFNNMVVWVGLSNSSHFVSLYDAISESLGSFDKFHPHITLVRVKTPQKLSLSFEVNPVCFDISEFHLYSSELTSKGPIHTKLHSFQLNL